MPYARLCLKERFCFVRELTYETQGFSFEILYQLGIRAAFFLLLIIFSPKGKAVEKGGRFFFKLRINPLSSQSFLTLFLDVV